MTFTDHEIVQLVQEVTVDVTGTLTPQTAQMANFLTPALSDKITYANEKKQYILETIVMGTGMPGAWEGLPEEEETTRRKIITFFLGQIKDLENYL